MAELTDFTLDFACIGATKAGTTWLSHVLRQHPELNVSINKGPCYFSNHYELGLEWNARNSIDREGLKGAFSNHYLFNRRTLAKCSPPEHFVLDRSKN